MLEKATATRAIATRAASPARVFVALTIVPAVARALARFAEGIEALGARPVPSRDIHLTLVPPWRPQSIAQVIEKLHDAVSGTRPFRLSFGHVGYGPQARWPRLLWAECAAGDDLSRLRAALLRAFPSADERSFRPHVTLARLPHNGRSVARRHPIDAYVMLAQRVASVELFGSPPAGQRGYRLLASVPLGEEPSGSADAVAQPSDAPA